MYIFIIISDNSKSFALGSLSISNVNNATNNTVSNQEVYDEMNKKSHSAEPNSFCGGPYCSPAPPGTQP